MFTVPLFHFEKGLFESKSNCVCSTKMKVSGVITSPETLLNTINQMTRHLIFTDVINFGGKNSNL